MPDITRDQIDELVKLQQIEIETRKITAKLSNVNQRLEKLDDKLLDFKQVIEQKESVIDELNQKYRSYESDAQMNLDRIKKSEAKLSSVKTNKEYQSSLKEIDDLKEKNSMLEDDMIECLDRLEEAENALNAKMNEYSELEAQMKAEKEIIQRESEEDSRQLGNLNTEWNTVSEGIEAELLGIFNQIKETQTNKIGIVAVKNAACQGCHMNIPPQMYNELQRGDKLKRCPICERIIYWKNENKRPE
jgi:predicted  nucleic acid-binding Zn-ribbon protein